MLKPNGAAELTAFTEKSYKETITPIVPGIWHVLGVGHSNAVIIEGRTSVILVDTLDTLERGQKLLEIIRSKTEKPVKTILYTHGHPDHRGGAGAFSGTDPEIIAFASATPVLKKTEMLQDIQNLRGIRQLSRNIRAPETVAAVTAGHSARRSLELRQGLWRFRHAFPGHQTRIRRYSDLFLSTFFLSYVPDGFKGFERR